VTATPVRTVDLPARVGEIDWFHSIELEPGLKTRGSDDTVRRLDILQIPDDLSGKTVLDVGAFDGFFSFEAERRGAERVVALDSHAWLNRNRGKDGFELAREALGSRVEDVEMEVLDISPERIGRFDVVLFLGVLYHMRHPLLALEKVASVTDELLIVETHVDMLQTRRPAIAMYPGHELGFDPTNWWGPNPEAVVAMLRDVGFSEAAVVTHDSTPYRAARMGRRALRELAYMVRQRAHPPERITQGRAVVHARRGG
jgi:tRNA (mo5U34)-methyltransferase